MSLLPLSWESFMWNSVKRALPRAYEGNQHCVFPVVWCLKRIENEWQIKENRFVPPLFTTLRRLKERPFSSCSGVPDLWVVRHHPSGTLHADRGLWLCHHASIYGLAHPHGGALCHWCTPLRRQGAREVLPWQVWPLGKYQLFFGFCVVLCDYVPDLLLFFRWVIVMWSCSSVLLFFIL